LLEKTATKMANRYNSLFGGLDSYHYLWTKINVLQKIEISH
jgi:hypothetical protein